jgi:hypothetical protein
MTEVLVVMLWQVVLMGAWGLTRRIRRLERSPSPQVSAQVGALRETMVSLRNAYAYDIGEQERQARRVARFIERSEAQLDGMTARLETISQTLLYQMALIEEHLDREPATATSFTLAEQSKS